MRYISVCSGIEAATVAWHPLGWEPVAFAEIDAFPSAVLAHHFPTVPNLGDISKVDWRPYHGTVDLVVGGTPCQSFSIAGLSGKTCPALFPVTKELTSNPFSGNGINAGIMSRGECLTLSFSESPSAAVESSLSDILETGDIPHRFFLSRTACEGILRRAQKRGKALPPMLKAALEATGTVAHTQA